LRVIVSHEDFDVGAQTAALLASSPGAGGLASFVGIVRSDAARPILALTLEHYPGMTERALSDIAERAQERFGLLGCTIIHRYGKLLPGEQIVLVLAAAAHRAAALEACAFLIDWLKTAAPFWKKEHFADGMERWVEARAADDAAAARWKEGLLF
jgi:molybdopterin synthase catalytic subunit